MTNLRTVLGFAIIFAVAIPFIPLLLWSVAEQWFYPALLPQKIGFRGWQYIFDTAASQIGVGLLQSTLLALVTSFLSLVIGTPAARALGLYDFPGKKLVGLLLLLPIIVPTLCVSMGFHLWFIRLGLAETFTGVVLIHLTFCLPYSIYVLWGVFSDYNPDFEQQARSLGANRVQVFFRVTLPMIAPGLSVAALFSFLLSWSQYLSTLIIGGGKLLTLPILLFSLMDSGDRPVAAVVSLLFVLPTFAALAANTHFLGKQGLQGIR